jgi:hypothetical protein
MGTNEHQPTISDGAIDVVEDTARDDHRLLRRGILGGAVGAVAALAVGRASPVSAADGDNVRAGLTTTSLNTTVVANGTTTSAVGFRATATSASYGTGVEGNGSAYGVVGNGGQYAGVAGDSARGTGVSGQARATSGPAAGVSGYAFSVDGVGVAGASPNIGVGGRADNDFRWPTGTPIGMYGVADIDGGVGAMFAGRRAPLRLVPADASGAPAAGQHEIGELVVDSAGRVFVCTAAGTPGTWNELGAAAAAPPAATIRPTLQLLPTPERFVDTRRALGGVQGVVAAGTTHTFSLTGRDGQALDPALRIPDEATAIVGNLTVIGAPGTPGAYLTMWPGGEMPTVSNINYGPNSVGDAIANGFTVGLADAGDGHSGVRLFNFGQCDYIIDVTGYYVPA